MSRDHAPRTPYPLLLGSVLLCLATSCKTPEGAEISAADSQAAAIRNTWLDVTGGAQGQGRACDPANSEQLCLFHDTARGLIWSAPLGQNGTPQLLTWKAAKARCQALRSPKNKDKNKDKTAGSGNFAWRLPTRAEYEAAVRDDSGALRPASLIALGDQSPEFVRVVPFQALWTSTAESDANDKYWAAERLDNYFMFSVHVDGDKLPFRCVRKVDKFLNANINGSEAAIASGSMPKTVSATTAPELDDTSNEPRDRTPTTATQPRAERKPSTEYSLDDLSRRPPPATSSKARTRITGYLKKAFAAAGFDGHLIAAGGDLLISSTSGFVFSDKSAQIVRDQIGELRQVLTEYVKILGAVQTLDATKIRLQVIGYASPSYQGNPQVGFDPEDEGAMRNRIIGMRRADQVAGLLAEGDPNGSLAVDIFSMGSEEGVIDPSGPNSKCGDFSCVASRRVIIRFLVDAGD